MMQNKLLTLLFILSMMPLPMRADPTIPDGDPSITREALFQPRAVVQAVVSSHEGGIDAQPSGPGRWDIAGTLEGDAGTIRFAPADGPWDFSDYSLFSITLTNNGPGLVWLEAQLDNQGALAWDNSSMSLAYLMPGETQTLTVGYPRSGKTDDSPAIFNGMAGKPTGWRSHWKRFNPAAVIGCRLVVRSTHKRVLLENTRLLLAWPYGSENNAALVATPYLDRYGQAIPFDWPTKIHSDKDLLRQREQEQAALQADRGPASFNRFGGWAGGPQREATGFFRTEQIDGKWWLVDPDGRLFWSHGACSISSSASTPLNEQRNALFSWVPEPGDAEYDVAVSQGGKTINYLSANSFRKYGDDWRKVKNDIIHARLRAWGMNTIGAWADNKLFESKRTAFTEILHVWHGPRDLDKTPDPFEPGFEKRYHDAARQLAKKRRDDPWMIGVFIDNEVHWHNDMIEKILGRGPEQPAYRRLIEALKEKYNNLDALNTAWQTHAADWDTLVPGEGEVWRADRDGLYRLIAERYYSVCRAAMDEHLPNHLYLGSRIHSCPNLVAESAARHVDVFSVNHYWSLAGTGRLPRGADLPVMITEFHFGTADRGVMGMSLFPLHGQTQRARGYAGYVTAGLMHPNIVGTHWFAYADQSAVGRPGENYQIGLIDITDTPYRELTAMTRAIGERMYEIRQGDNADLLKEVQNLINKAD